MRDKLKGAVLGALVAACATVLLAQTPPWTAPITWTTGDLLTASQFNAQFRDNLLNLRAFAACADTGITGTASEDTVLFGDCSWSEIPTQYVMALDSGETETTSRTFVNAGNAATIGVASGSVRIYITGVNNPPGSSTRCDIRLRNVTTAIDVYDQSQLGGGASHILVLVTDSSPSTTSDNVYQVQLRQSSGTSTCVWQTSIVAGLTNQRGLIAISDS